MADKTVKPSVWFLAIRAHSGTDIFTQRLCDELNRRGIRSEITWLPLRAEFAPWSVPRPPPPEWANVVHVNTWLHQRFLPPDLPVVATEHGCVHDEALLSYKTRAQAAYHRYWIRPMEAKVIRTAAAVTAVSHYTARKVAANFGREDIDVIYNGIPSGGVFQPDGRDKPHQPFRLLYIGNWSSRKGADRLGPVMERLGSGFELYYTEDRKGRQRRYSLPPSCRSLGRLQGESAVAEACRNADALLLPSRLEGFGLVALEAQACGLPVIATRGSSLVEVVQDGETGLLCDQDDIGAFARAAKSLATNHRLWRELRRAGPARVKAQFSESLLIDGYVEIYDRVLRQF